MLRVGWEVSEVTGEKSDSLRSLMTALFSLSEFLALEALLIIQFNSIHRSFL